jgi:antitoxin ParD1/3/4
MAAATKRTISLPVETADYIDAKVASGEYASASEVVRDGLRSLQARDAAIEKWLLEQVVPLAKAYDAHPERAIPIDDAFTELDRRIAGYKANPS